MSEVNYIDSAGNGEVVSAYTVVRNNGGRLKLLNLTKKVHDLLQISKLYTIFDVCFDEESAIDAFRLNRFLCQCPICGAFATTPGLPGTGPWPAQSCGRCRLHFVVSASDSGREVEVRSLTLQTFLGEQIELLTDPFFRVTVVGRLDLFSLSTLTKLSRKIPDGQKVLVDLSRVTDVEDEGWKALYLLLSSGTERIEAAVSVENIPSPILAGRTITPPFYSELVAARKALGKESSVQPWRVRTFEL
jgi:anti-anti-sigma regulatory factor